MKSTFSTSSFLKLIFISIGVLWFTFVRHAHAQLISYEPFTAMTVGPGIVGSGSAASGWTDSGWFDGTDSRFGVISPTPSFSYQIAGGGLLSGGDRAILLATAPEPTPTNLLTYRTFSPQSTTLYFSFLVRPQTIGTGSDSIEFRIGDGNLPKIAFRPSGSNGTITPWLLTPSESGMGIGNALQAGQTYFIVVRLQKISASGFVVGAWINPMATETTPTSSLGNVFTSAPISRIGFKISSTDIGGPTSAIAIDEFRLGYLWEDVVPQAPLQTVPNVEIAAAHRLRWQTQVGKTYQVQYSYDMVQWFDLGASFSGNDLVKEVFDSTEADPKKFYRVKIW